MVVLVIACSKFRSTSEGQSATQGQGGQEAICPLRLLCRREFPHAADRFAFISNQFRDESQLLASGGQRHFEMHRRLPGGSNSDFLRLVQQGDIPLQEAEADFSLPLLGKIVDRDDGNLPLLTALGSLVPESE